MEDYNWDVEIPIVFYRKFNWSTVDTGSVIAASLSTGIVGFAVRMAAPAERRVRGCAK